MADPSTQDILDFMHKFKTRKDLEAKFGWSNTQSYHQIRWLLKAGLIEEVCRRESGKTNRVWYYKALPQ